MPGGRARWWLARLWLHVLDLALTVWVLRAPVVAVLAGASIMLLTPQAQDLLVELATPSGANGWMRIGVFYALLLFVWAMPTHYVARLLVKTDVRYRRRLARRNTAFLYFLEEWMPRLLGAATFLIMMLAALRSQRNLPTVTVGVYDVLALSLHLALIAFGIFALGAVFLAYVILRNRLVQRSFTQKAEAFAAVPMARVRRAVPGLRRGARASQSQLGPLILLAMFVVFALFPLIGPETFATMFPRASSVPFVLGGWLPLAAYLTAWGRRLRAPLIVVAFTMLAILLLAFGDNYPVRLIEPAKTVERLTGSTGASVGDLTGGIKFDDAVTMWKRANKCEQGGCPRPIIVAAAGGASRAGFFTASVLGQLLDDGLRPDGGGHGLAADEVSKRLFALSAVSGSSVGAVMTVAALAASKQGRQPCAARSDPLWHGKEIDNWRGCLEALMAGDFLTSAFVGFTFRDLFRFVGWQDRAALLERSWEARFGDLLRVKPQKTAALACAGSLECPFMTLRPTEQGAQVYWLPLLVLNGTSVGNGQRIITTPLDADYILQEGDECALEPRADLRCQLFPQARLFHNFLIGDGAVFKDVRVSTAAHNSARFPLVSPPGEITDGRKSPKQIVDRIVDGGYFENFGAQTATELALAMRAIDPALNPFILVLSNDPQVPQKKLAAQRAIYSTEGSLFTDISGPIGAFANTRNARGTLAVDGAAAALDGDNLAACNVGWIRVWAEPVAGSDKPAAEAGGDKARAVSMSWWLSKPVQVYLREQTDYAGGVPVSKFSDNRKPIGYLLAALAAKGGVGSGTPECPQSADD